MGKAKAARTRSACSKHGLHVNSQLHAAAPPTATTPLVRTALTLQNLSSELYLAVAFLLLHHRSDCRRCFAQIAGESTRLAEPRGPHRGLARHRCSPHQDTAVGRGMEPGRELRRCADTVRLLLSSPRAHGGLSIDQVRRRE